MFKVSSRTLPTGYALKRRVERMNRPRRVTVYAGFPKKNPTPHRNDLIGHIAG